MKWPIDISGWKITSYWYNEMVNWIDKLNEFIEGELAIYFENHDEYAVVLFGDSKAIIKIVHFEYHDYLTYDLKEE